MNCTLNAVITTFLQLFNCLNESTLTDFSGVGSASSCTGAGPKAFFSSPPKFSVSNGLKRKPARAGMRWEDKFFRFILILILKREIIREGEKCCKPKSLPIKRKVKIKPATP